MSKSLLASHGGSMAGVNACTKGCMSVLERSYFSYQVAAGSTMSESNVVEVIRKSADNSRSSFPSGVSSCQATSRGRTWALPSSAMTLEWVPSRYLRKYSLPFADEPNRFERHSVRVRGQFSGASMSSIEALIVPAARRSRRRRPRPEPPRHRLRPGLVGEVQWIDVELWVEGHPAQPRRLGDGVGGVHAGEVALSER